MSFLIFARKDGLAQDAFLLGYSEENIFELSSAEMSSAYI